MPPEPTPTSSPTSGTHKHDLEATLATLLTGGTAISAIVLLVGVVLYLRQDHATTLNFRTFTPTEQGSVVSVFAQSTRLDGASIMQLGVVLLILTPVSRVLLTLVAFLFKRDWLYVVVTLIVSSVLIYGLLGGRVHP